MKRARGVEAAKENNEEGRRKGRSKLNFKVN